MDALSFLSAAELAARIRERLVSPRDVVEACVRRIESIDPQLGAFVELDAERALAEADAIDSADQRPFAGVPIAVKANTPVAGQCMNFGSTFLAGHRPTHSAYLVRRLREAGFVIVGTTNMPEFGILPTTESRHTGPARNPWDTSRTPGGSSGGSAAAVAAGMTAIGYGNDGGGSIRIPASCCGLVGLKPSRGRISVGPTWTELVARFAIEGVVTRTVADTAAALDVMAGPEPGDPYWAPPPADPFSKSVGRDPGKLRIAYFTDAPNGAPVHEHCVAAAREAVELLESLGHEVGEATFDFDGDAYVENFVKVWLGVTGDEIRDYEELFG